MGILSECRWMPVLLACAPAYAAGPAEVTEAVAVALGYPGLPCRDSHGGVVGHIACCHDRPLRRDLPDEAILRLFAERAALAPERRRLGCEQHSDRIEARA